MLRLTPIGDLLVEVAVPVEKPYPGQWESPIAGRLEVITGEDPQTAGVLGNERIDAELRGAVGDLWRHWIFQDGVEVGDLDGDALHERTVTEEIVELLGREVRDDRDRMSRRSGTGQREEKLSTGRRPSPAMIGGEAVQCLVERRRIQVVPPHEQPRPSKGREPRPSSVNPRTPDP